MEQRKASLGLDLVEKRKDGFGSLRRWVCSTNSSGGPENWVATGEFHAEAMSIGSNTLYGVVLWGCGFPPFRQEKGERMGNGTELAV
jgi:hypothetical protein